jgi:hypothetical protein
MKMKILAASLILLVAIVSGCANEDFEPVDSVAGGQVANGLIVGPIGPFGSFDGSARTEWKDPQGFESTFVKIVRVEGDKSAGMFILGNQDATLDSFVAGEYIIHPPEDRSVAPVGPTLSVCSGISEERISFDQYAAATVVVSDIPGGRHFDIDVTVRDQNDLEQNSHGSFDAMAKVKIF